MPCVCFFFFNDPATTEIYTLSLHDALPIPDSVGTLRHPARAEGRILGGPPRPILRRLLQRPGQGVDRGPWLHPGRLAGLPQGDRKSTRLNSSHLVISYAVFCLKKKKRNPTS